MAHIVLVPGAAVGPQVWARCAGVLTDLGHVVATPDRPRSGDLATELAALAPLVDGAWVVGMSGGATLGLALAAQGIPLAGAVLHEPAVGSLLPGLLGPIAAAFASGGTHGFARALYGPAWSPSLLGDLDEVSGIDDTVTARELAMFRAFEPARAHPDAGQVLVTWGSASGPQRAAAAAALSQACGHRIAEIPGAAHFVGHDLPELFATVIDREVRASPEIRFGPSGQRAR
ncbi:alpha/beta fold hydrolase [Nocardioides cavernaquae]|uniref:alpha/beta fold hydrolase n=1 Tax=Nocardioides cavernaquae TaxID=2321396 RepID=UPI0015FEEF0B|nr:alpha/beta fold hydrolase [Nocardioides cavernaquae]